MWDWRDIQKRPNPVEYWLQKTSTKGDPIAISIIPHQKRYLPHEMGTRIHAITLYRSAKDIEFVCRRHKIQKPPSCTGTSVMMVRQNLSLTGRIAPIPYIPEHIPTLSLVFQQRKAPKIQGDIMDSVYGNASYLIAFISLTSLTNLHFLFSTKKGLLHVSTTCSSSF